MPRGEESPKKSVASLSDADHIKDVTATTIPALPAPLSIHRNGVATGCYSIDHTDDRACMRVGVVAGKRRMAALAAHLATLTLTGWIAWAQAITAWKVANPR